MDKPTKPTKPITLKITEFNQSIVKDINESGLPMWKIRDELEKILRQVVNACAEEEKREIEQYNQAMIEYNTMIENSENKANTQE